MTLLETLSMVNAHEIAERKLFQYLEMYYNRKRNYPDSDRKASDFKKG
jgi:hypothetical protein